ncbi:MAG: hypothetical protein ABIR06_08925 [Cyclobacteriaceae bacterium]
MNPVEKYFNGEKTQCSFGIAMAILSIALACYFLFSVKTDFYKGIAYPFILFSGLLLVVCISVILRSSTDIARVNHFVQHEPASIRQKEIPRMRKVMQTFKNIKIVEICLALTGLGLLLFSGNFFLKGIGPGLLIQAMLLYGFDIIAESREKIYLEFLHGLYLQPF